MTKAEFISAFRRCAFGLVGMPALVLLMALLDGHDRAMQGLRLLAVCWAIMAPLLLLHLHLDRKESE